MYWPEGIIFNPLLIVGISAIAGAQTIDINATAKPKAAIVQSILMRMTNPSMYVHWPSYIIFPLRRFAFPGFGDHQAGPAKKSLSGAHASPFPERPPIITNNYLRRTTLGRFTHEVVRNGRVQGRY
jgi:hypothetical protein